MFYPTGLLWAAINTRIEEAAYKASREAEPGKETASIADDAAEGDPAGASNNSSQALDLQA